METQLDVQKEVQDWIDEQMIKFAKSNQNKKETNKMETQLQKETYQCWNCMGVGYDPYKEKEVAGELGIEYYGKEVEVLDVNAEEDERFEHMENTYVWLDDNWQDFIED